MEIVNISLRFGIDNNYNDDLRARDFGVGAIIITFCCYSWYWVYIYIGPLYIYLFWGETVPRDCKKVTKVKIISPWINTVLKTFQCRHKCADLVAGSMLSVSPKQWLTENCHQYISENGRACRHCGADRYPLPYGKVIYDSEPRPHKKHTNYLP